HADSIRKFGGVCAMQADFAARVAKSMAVPAAYVGGGAGDLEVHAWGMWGELRGVQNDRIDFDLMWHGRYLQGDYYTGTLRDPHTGEKILDRDWERRLGAAGTDRSGNRQAELAMRAYPRLVEELKLDVKKQVAFLDGCLKLCPLHEAAWMVLSRMARDNE